MDEQEQTIDLRVLFRVFAEHIIPIVIVAVLAAGIGFSLASFVIAKQYTSSAMLYVENSTKKNEESLNINDINAAQKIVSTCQILFTSDYILGELEDAFGGRYTAAQLNKMITIESVNNTQILKISVKSTSPTEAKEIADKLAELSQIEFLRVIKNGSIEVVSEATLPVGHTFPSVTTFTAVGFVLGLFGSYFIFLLIEIFDTKVKADDDLAQIYGIPVFAEIMDFEASVKSGYKYESYGGKSKSSGEHRSHSSHTAAAKATNEEQEEA